MKKLYENHNFLNKDIKYIKDSIITEYDMQNAGLSILLHEGLITQKNYDKLMNNYDKHDRDVVVGKFLKNHPKISKELMEGFVSARKEFFEVNEIDDMDVLSIKKDAIFLVNRSVNQTKINEDYNFRVKNQYNCYMNIRGKEFYYSTDTDELTVKGISTEIISNQENYLLQFIKDCLRLDLTNQKDRLFEKLLVFKNDFLTFNLDKEFYRDITTNSFILTNGKYFLELANISDISEYINTLFNKNNLNFIIEMISNFMI